MGFGARIWASGAVLPGRARQAVDAERGVALIWRQDVYALPNGRTSFGLKDGISRPAVEGSGEPGTNPHETPLKAGEFVLGYPDETGTVTPLPEPDVLGRNGTYVVDPLVGPHDGGGRFTVPREPIRRRLNDLRGSSSTGAAKREHTVTGVQTDDAGATVAISLPDGFARTDPRGLRGRLRQRCTHRGEQAGIGFTGGRYAESFAQADVHMDWPLSRREVHLFFSPAGLVVVAPLPEDRYRVVATMDEAPDHPALADVQTLLDARGPARERVTVRDVVWSSRFHVHHRLAETYRRGRVFLAGDAALVHSPAGGQGMNTGIQDAMALAALLGDALGGPSDVARLDTYEATRRPIAREVITTTHGLTHAATIRNPLARALRNVGFRGAGQIPPVRQRRAMNLSELATTPRARPKSTAGTSLRTDGGA